MTHVWFFVQSDGVSMGKGVRIPNAKNIGFVMFLLEGGWWGKTNLIHHSGWEVISCIFKATILYLRVAVEINISGEGRKERRRKRVQWGFFFHFHFYIKVLRPQWKKFFLSIYIINQSLWATYFCLSHLQKCSHIDNGWIASCPKTLPHSKTNKKKSRCTMIQLR